MTEQDAIFTDTESEGCTGATGMLPVYECRPVPSGIIKIGVNKPCPCGSNKKFKKCCKILDSKCL